MRNRFWIISIVCFYILSVSLPVYAKEPYVEEYEEAVDLEGLDADLNGIRRAYGMEEDISFLWIYRLMCVAFQKERRERIRREIVTVKRVK